MIIIVNLPTLLLFMVAFFVVLACFVHMKPDRPLIKNAVIALGVTLALCICISVAVFACFKVPTLPLEPQLWPKGWT